jgi:hypothetical protein
MAGVVGIHAIAVQFLEIGENAADVIQRVGALRMARQLRDLPGRQVGEDRSGERAALGAQLGDLLLDVDLGVRGHMAKLFDLGLKFGDWLLKIEEADGHLARNSFHSSRGAKGTGSGPGSARSAASKP